MFPPLLLLCNNIMQQQGWSISCNLAAIISGTSKPVRVPPADGLNIGRENSPGGGSFRVGACRDEAAQGTHTVE